MIFLMACLALFVAIVLYVWALTLISKVKALEVTLAATRDREQAQHDRIATLGAENLMLQHGIRKGDQKYAEIRKKVANTARDLAELASGE